MSDRPFDEFALQVRRMLLTSDPHIVKTFVDNGGLEIPHAAVSGACATEQTAPSWGTCIHMHLSSHLAANRLFSCSGARIGPLEYSMI